ncbi:NUDIX hydrolase [Lichenihabitans sp. PAMC28606]|uniref:NUDIX domain-containing protein n=1 Tax=Lichenihabitans sp. PAMC28606 TaxID=2880932 RepID=UPI001D0A83D0|nr:NUDIX hydrolase [Lichenihabitans sp. PAMC28606]UDL93056.1 NUDIX hydrolase [Lichenihabitans sp. PAMC28606]
MQVVIERVETAYKGWLRLLLAHMRSDAGDSFQRVIEDHGNGVAVLPYDRERRVALVVRLPRAPVIYAGETTLLIEAPAGLIDEGEDAETAARREAMEEAGVRLSGLEPLGTIWTMAGISTERMSMFLAPYDRSDRIAQGGGLAVENENITVEERPLSELADLADANRLTDIRLLTLLLTLRVRHPALFA